MCQCNELKQNGLEASSPRFLPCSHFGPLNFPKIIITRIFSYLLHPVFSLSAIRISLSYKTTWVITVECADTRLPTTSPKKNISPITLVWHWSRVNSHARDKSRLCFVQITRSVFSSLLTYKWWHDDVIKWKHCSRYWPFVPGIHRSPVNSLHEGQWRGALMFSLICEVE